VWGRGEVYSGVCREDLRERGHLEDLGVEGSVVLKWVVENRIGGRGLE
jgi:hypothetical protein